MMTGIHITTQNVGPYYYRSKNKILPNNTKLEGFTLVKFFIHLVSCPDGNL